LHILSWLLSLPVAVAIVLFAVSNRDLVTLGMWPLPFTIQAPVYVALLTALAAGILSGGLATWLAGRSTRRKLRQSEDQAAELERKLKARVDTTARSEV
jgi:uncharacterized integral membrane protein